MKRLRIRDFAKVRRGASPRPIDDPRYFGGSVGWVRISDVTASRKYLCRTTQQLSALGESMSVRVGPGDLILSICATLGRPILVQIPACIHDGFVHVYGFERTADVEFLYYQFEAMQPVFEKAGQSGTQTNLNSGIVEDTELFLPDIASQQATARVLAAVDRAIEQTEALLTKQQHIKTGLVHDLLTRGLDAQGRLRDPSMHRFKQTVLGMVPEDWEETSLGDLTTLITSGPRGWARYYANAGAKFIRIGNLTREHVNLRLMDMQLVNPPIGAEGNRTQLAEGDVLFSITADLGVVGLIPGGFGTAYINQHIALIRSRPHDVVPGWLANFLASHRMQQWIANINESGAKAGLNLPTVKELPVTVPKFAEQKQIADILSLCDHQIAETRAQIDKFRRKKAGLMQDLLTGRVPVTPLLSNSTL